ncbi:MAG: DUF975 family protein [Lachnospiraceae bacterium]|nr:DUF975 family protein [Lachnospiraceae bacterium]
MKQLKTSSALKADAKEILLGKYKTAVLAYVIMELIVSGCLTLIELQVNLQTAAGMLLYYAVYFIVVLLSTVLVVGQNHLYLNFYRGAKYETRDIWIGFRTCADRAILIYLTIFGKTFLCCIPCMIATAIMIFTQNYYFALLVAAGIVFALVKGTLIQLDYSQALYLILDHPEQSVGELLSGSKSMMKGHRGSYFYLLVSFLGIFLLSIMTFGLGMLWIYPYFTATKTGYYLELTKQS